MNKAILLFLALSFSHSSWAYQNDYDPAPTGARPSWTIHADGGILLNPADNQTGSHFTHDPWSSYLMQVGGFYNFPKKWRKLYFFGGPEFDYIYSYETLNSQSGNSALGTTMYQFLLTAGIGFEPDFLGGDWGGTFFVSGEIWGTKETRIDTSGFNRQVGNSSTDVPLTLGVTAYYKITDEWRPFFAYQSKNSLTGRAGFSILSLGLSYGF